MTWDAHAGKLQRVPAWVVEVDLTHNAGIPVDDYAAVNDDGSLCYGTPATTLQTPDPGITTKTRRWMSIGIRPLASLDAIPCVSAVRLGGEELKLGKGLGYFGSATITLDDFVDNDARAEDPFASHASRSGIDPEAGTYFTKLFARNPYWTGREVRIYEGWLTDGVWTPADAIVHYFNVRDVQGPSNGKFEITAAGPLQLLNLADLEAPAPSAGTLAATINNSTTSAAIHDAVIAGDYPASGLLRIEDEVCTFTRSGVNLTLTRARYNTTAEAHEAGVTVQLCAEYIDQNITDILEDLLTTYGGVDPALLDLTGWATEQTEWLSGYILSGIVTTPTKIMDVVRELLEASGSVLWWDDTTGKVRLRAIRTTLPSDALWTDNLHLMSRPIVKREMGERISRTDVLMDLRNGALDPQDASSYRLRVVGDPQGEQASQHGSSKLKLIASRWLSVSQITLAQRAIYLQTYQLRDGRVTITAEVSAKDAWVQLGDVVTISSSDIVDRKGAAQATRCVVIKREPIKAGSTYRYTIQPLPQFGRALLFADNATPDYDDATPLQREQAGFIAADTRPYFSDNSEAYVFTE